MSSKSLNITLQCLSAALVFAVQSTWAQPRIVEGKALGTPNPLVRPPAEIVRYQARLYELLDPDEAKYDATFARQLTMQVTPQITKQENFLARMTSGPTSAGSVHTTADHAYVYYGVCQAHHCDTTTMEVLFVPSTKRMVGKILDRCVLQWFGQASKEEMALFDEQQRRSYPAAQSACAGSKNERNQ